MPLNFTAPEMTELKPRIVVIGVGGAGGNAVNNMISSGLDGVEFVVANTDAQALAQSQAERKLQLGAAITQGLGCGARPDVGRAAAEEAMDQVLDHLNNAHMAFITAGMGGGTGTGAAPVIARACREQGILTVGVVTKPFHFEGTHRMRIAEAGIDELQRFVDTLIIIPNQNLFRIANEKTTFADAFAMADDVLHSGVRGITDLMVMPGLINLDFADVKTVMSEMGKAMMGTGEAEGERRAIDAAEAAIANPLLDEVSMKGAKGVLINITGGMDLTLYEVDEAANRIREEVDPEANIIVGSALDASLNGRMRVSVVATGIDAQPADEMGRGGQPRLYAVGGGRAAPAAPASGPVAEAAPPARALVEPAAAPERESILARAGERVELPAAAAPQPKPLQPERDPLPVRAQPFREEVSDEPFVAPRPIEPRVARDPLRAPDPIAEADAVNAGPPPAERRRARALSLFARMTGAARGEPAPEPARAEPAPLLSRAEPAEPRPSPAKLAMPADERLTAARPQDEDLLEIPSFLRRQAN